MFCSRLFSSTEFAVSQRRGLKKQTMVARRTQSSADVRTSFDVDLCSADGLAQLVLQHYFVLPIVIWTYASDGEGGTVRALVKGSLDMDIAGRQD